jgi:hypothetical protein
MVQIQKKIIFVEGRASVSQREGPGSLNYYPTQSLPVHTSLVKHLAAHQNETIGSVSLYDKLVERELDSL